MKTANRLGFSFGVMLLAVVLVGAAAAGAIRRTARTVSDTLRKSFEVVSVLEELGEVAREYSLTASGIAATATLGDEQAQKLGQAEIALQTVLVQLQGADQKAADEAGKVISDEIARTGEVLKSFASTEPAPAAGRKPGARTSGEALLETTQLRLLALERGHRASMQLNGLHQEVSLKLTELRQARQAAIDVKLRELNEEGARLLQVVVGLAVVAGIIVLALFVGIRRGVIRPLQGLVAAARRVAGERDLTLTVPVSGDAEVQDLGRAFGEMIERLRDITVEIHAATDRLLNSSSQLGEVTRAQGESMSRQATALQEARQTSVSLRESSRSAAAQAHVVLRVAERAEELGRDGEAAMTESLSSVEVIQGQTHGVVQRISRLAASAQRIGAITELVKELADQSNVLALNAAIEAHRAGEAGRGFVVVAREMRSLADQSLRATSEVHTVLADVLTGIREAAALAEATTAGLSEGTARTRRLGDSVSGLTGIVRENLGAVREIAGAVSSQDAGIEQISGAVEDLSLMMSDSLKTATTTEEAAALLKQVSEQVSSAVRAFRL